MSRIRRTASLSTAAALLAGLALLVAGAAEPERPPPRVAPEIHGEVWLNGGPLSMEALRGRVVLVEFWTFACWNCRNVEPWLKRWHARWAEQGLVTIAVHTPELEFEHDVERVRAYVAEHELRYPVAVDPAFTTWRRYRNRAWPTIYLVDKRGRIRHVQVGEGGYGRTEAAIRELLAEEAGPEDAAP